jgi:hypothetical protein
VTVGAEEEALPIPRKFLRACVGSSWTFTLPFVAIIADVVCLWMQNAQIHVMKPRK